MLDIFDMPNAAKYMTTLHGGDDTMKLLESGDQESDGHRGKASR